MMLMLTLILRKDARMYFNDADNNLKEKAFGVVRNKGIIIASRSRKREEEVVVEEIRCNVIDRPSE